MANKVRNMLSLFEKLWAWQFNKRYCTIRLYVKRNYKRGSGTYNECIGHFVIMKKIAKKMRTYEEHENIPTIRWSIIIRENLDYKRYVKKDFRKLNTNVHKSNLNEITRVLRNNTSCKIAEKLIKKIKKEK